MKGPLTDTFIPTNLSLPEFILGQLEHFGDKTALIDGITGCQLSYAQIHREVIKVANAIRHKYGLGKGHVVCLFLPNCAEFAILTLATLLTGATVTTCNPAYTTEELHNQLTDSKAGIVVTTSTNIDKVVKAYQGNISFKDIISLDGTAGKNYTLYSELHRYADSVVSLMPSISSEDVALILYSSGTTGKPKGVMLTHQNCVSNLYQLRHPSLKSGGPEDTYLAVSPFFHVYGMNVILMLGVSLGVTLVTLPRFLPEVFLHCIEKYKVTVLHIAPPTALFLSKSPLVDRFSLSSVKRIFCAASTLNVQVAEAMCRRLKVDILYQGYGMTEASPGVLNGLPGRSPSSSLGVILPNTEVKVIDIKTGEELPHDQEGEICVRGPQVMKGYLGNERATSEMLGPDGWLHTGDIAYYTKDGHFYLRGRLKELIKYKAYQVAPAELEDVLLSHPAISDAAVIGRPELEAGELPTAFVVAKNGISGQEIQEYVAKKVAPYKHLRGGVYFVEAIPRSSVGKILRRVLKDRLTANLKAKL